MWKKILLGLIVLFLIGCGGMYAGYRAMIGSLPAIDSLKDYDPLLVSQVYDRNGKKIGEFFRNDEERAGRRVLIPYDKMPKDLVHAFLAAEDSQFFEHGGVNWIAMTRAFLANLRAGHTVQGGSTITQQVAKTMLLSAERSYGRKIREVILAQRMEEKLSKEEILYLYLNQIFFGQNSYGVAVAAETYFRKPVEKLTIGEMAILASLPKAPSAFSPVKNPVRAKERQIYVLNRMADLGYISKDQAKKIIEEPITVYLREDYYDHAPHYLEALKQVLTTQLGEDALDKGVRIDTSLDLQKQIEAEESVKKNMKSLDKRQGYRGPLDNVTEPKAVGEFLLKTRNQLIQEAKPERVIQANGQFVDYGPLNLSYDLKNGLPFYLKPGQTAKAIVSKVDDNLGLVYIRVAELEGLIDFESMQWARKVNPEKKYYNDYIKKPSQALKTGDVILIKVNADRFDPAIIAKIKGKKKDLSGLPDFNRYIHVDLDQDPVAEAALFSIDQANGDILAMVGGLDFVKSKYNRALQAARQTGSLYKAIVYAAALDHGYTPSTPIMDAPIVYEEESGGEGADAATDPKVWKPSNDTNSFGGDVIMRTALSKSLNVPSVKIIEDIGVPFALDYSKRLGITANLNPDFTLVLGSSSVTLYEMTKVFSQFGRGGKRVRPVIVHKVTDRQGQKLLDNVTLDLRFEKDLRPQEEAFESRRKEYQEKRQAANGEPLSEVEKKKIDSHIFFEDADQLISQQTAYLITSMLKAVVEDKRGTGGAARAVGREIAGKTGTTQNYVDAWFIGFSQQIATGVWVGFDQEKPLGKGEFGATAALPIWSDYMKSAHEGLPQMTLPVPEGIVFANIDADTGQLASASSKNIIRQAFLEGTEPKSSKSRQEEDTDFYKQDLSE